MTDIAKLRAILEAAEKATPGAWHSEIVEACEPDAPDIWRIFAGSDSSHEGTLCELWSGEHDNKECAEYLAMLDPATVTEIVKDALRWQLRMRMERDPVSVNALMDYQIAAELAKGGDAK